MWPFDKRLGDQNALQKYSRWLKRWFFKIPVDLTSGQFS